MKRHWLLGLGLMVNAFLAADNEISLDSEEAVYDGKRLLLSGHVFLEHDLGKLYADKIVMTPSENDKKHRFAVFDLEKDVKIVLQEGGELTGGRAHLDYTASTGRVFGDASQEFVTYKGRQFLIVKSREMTLHAAHGQSKERFFTDIIAERQVTIDYRHDFIAAGDYAVYKNDDTILLRADGDGQCRMTNRHGDQVDAGKILIDTRKRHVHFDRPKGALNFAQKERIDFSSETLLWDEKKDILTLKDHVTIFQKGMGELAAEDEVRFHLRRVDGKRHLDTIESIGMTVLTHKEENDAQNHVLVCKGNVIVDHPGMKIAMKSPDLQEVNQISYNDTRGEMHADKALVEYEVLDKNIVPKMITLEGHVRMKNNHADNPAEEPQQLSYALADKVEYNPATKEVLFQANRGGRVLFFDQANNLQVSAPALRIKRDAVTKKDSIKGIGNVRFSFIQHEFEQLKQSFSLQTVNQEQQP